MRLGKREIYGLWCIEHHGSSYPLTWLFFSSSDAPFNRVTGIISFKTGHTHLLTGNEIEIVRALLESSRDRQYETK